MTKKQLTQLSKALIKNDSDCLAHCENLNVLLNHSKLDLFIDTLDFTLSACLERPNAQMYLEFAKIASKTTYQLILSTFADDTERLYSIYYKTTPNNIFFTVYSPYKDINYSYVL